MTNETPRSEAKTSLSLGTTQLELMPPAGVDLRIVLRQSLMRLPNSEPTAEGFAAHFVNNVRDLWPLLPTVRESFGWAKLIKVCLKLSTRRRKLYLIVRSRDKVLCSFGWVNIGISAQYAVGASDVVVGPIWTSPQARNLGLARQGLQLALSEMFKRGHRTFFIDTYASNQPCLAVVKRVGFVPAAAHWRLPRE
jgi:RimJ/RimL family protein N-acetyltransferase